MGIGILGAGAVGAAVARFVTAQGHDVLLANRTGGEKLAQAASAIGAGVQPASLAVAAASDIVILAVPWTAVADTLTGTPAWEGRILVDATNPFARYTPTLELEDMHGASASVRVAEHAPGARVVKAFNLPMVNFTKGPFDGHSRRVLFVSGDDTAAKAEVRELIESGGYATVDLGGLTDGGRMQQAGGPLAGLDFLIAGV